MLKIRWKQCWTDWKVGYISAYTCMLICINTYSAPCAFFRSFFLCLEYYGVPTRSTKLHRCGFLYVWYFYAQFSENKLRGRTACIFFTSCSVGTVHPEFHCRLHLLLTLQVLIESYHQVPKGRCRLIVKLMAWSYYVGWSFFPIIFICGQVGTGPAEMFSRPSTASRGKREGGGYGQVLIGWSELLPSEQFRPPSEQFRPSSLQQSALSTCSRASRSSRRMVMSLLLHSETSYQRTFSECWAISCASM